MVQNNMADMSNNVFLICKFLYITDYNFHIDEALHSYVIGFTLNMG